MYRVDHKGNIKLAQHVSVLIISILATFKEVCKKNIN